MKPAFEKIKDFKEEAVWAVVGATVREEKPGYKIFYSLITKGYKVYPVHPVYTEIKGEKVYPSVSSLPEIPGVVDLVVQPEIAYKTLIEAASLGINKFWFQPGTESPEALEFCRKNKLNCISSACVLKDMLAVE